MKLFSTLFFMVFVPMFLMAQMQTSLDVAMRYLESQTKTWGITQADISDLAISDGYTSEQTKATYLYLIQRHKGVEVYNAMTNLTIFNGKVLSAGNRLIPRLADKVNATKPVLTARQALESAIIHLGMQPASEFTVVKRVSSNEMTFDKGHFSRANVPVKLRYQPMADGSIRLAWDMAIDAVNGGDYWHLRIDALNGKVLDQGSYTLKCSFETGHADNCAHYAAIEHRTVQSVQQARGATMTNTTVAGTYNVLPFPVESPAHGARALVIEPADPVASPFGWHDTDGMPGAEFTTTRGNNVRAFEARNGNFSSNNNEPNGGANLVFDFPLDPTSEPDAFTAAATVNLFYAINRMHDITYHYGFTEEAGNFQTTNYTNFGVGGDHVNGLAQFGAVGLTNVNNADFSTMPDGTNGRMRMFLWDRSSSGALKYLTVTSPDSLSGTYTTATAAFGPPITASNPITGEIVIVQDNTNKPTLGCQIPANNLTGKIALIDRGDCEFGRKVVNAQGKGAIAVIICNIPGGTEVTSMGGGAVGSQANIPSVLISLSDCNKIRIAAGNGLTATLQAPANPEPPELVDGSLDNGVIAHEFAHGISNRLTGGPSNTGCLSGEEQMGEGWSDFFTLVTTADPNDLPNQRRGIGTFVTRVPNDGKGLRSFPYSTDFAINPSTYIDIRSEAVPHGVGSVWCAMLWDLYWAMADKYGYDPDFSNTSSGNNKAVRLVMEGMRIQPCTPGFVNGRDAILTADMLLFGGANQCTIWEVFARRGLGLNADQGLSSSRSDGQENYDVPDCRPELKVRKNVTPIIDAGDEIDVEVIVINDLPNPVTGVVLRDLIPDQTTLIAGSANTAFTQNGSELSFDIGSLNSGAKYTITYRVSTPNTLDSRLLFYDGCEATNDDVWLLDFESGANEPPIVWEIQNLFVHSGSNAWGIINADTTLRSHLLMINPVTLDATQPVLRFSHYYNTEYRADGGYLQVSVDYGDNWITIPSTTLFREGYGPAPLQYGTFAFASLLAFSGNGGGFVDTYADLSDYIGQDIMVRFNFGCDGNTAADGWFVDDFTIMDMYNYETPACVTYDQGVEICGEAPGRGTVVEYGTAISGTNNPTLEGISVYPNPVKESLYLTIDRNTPSDYEVILYSLDGRQLWTNQLRQASYQTMQIPLPATSAGMYILEVRSAEGVFVDKIVVRP